MVEGACSSDGRHPSSQLHLLILYLMEPETPLDGERFDGERSLLLTDIPTDLFAHIISYVLDTISLREAVAAVHAAGTCTAWHSQLRGRGTIWRHALCRSFPATAGVAAADYRQLWFKMLLKDYGDSEPATDLHALQAFVTVRRGTLGELVGRSSPSSRSSPSRAQTLLAQTLVGANHQPVAHRTDAAGEGFERPVGLEWHNLELEWPEEACAEHACASPSELLALIHKEAASINSTLLAVSVCLFRPSDGCVLQLPEARLYVPHGPLREWFPGALYFEPVDLPSFPKGAEPIYTPISHIVKCRLRPSRSSPDKPVTWSLALLFAKAAAPNAPNGDGDEEAIELDEGGEAPHTPDEEKHPFERGIDLSTRSVRMSYEDEVVGTLPEVLDVARWV